MDAMFEEALQAMSEASGLSVQNIKSGSRNRNIVGCRHILWHYLYSKEWSFSRIGRVMKRNHSTIMHGVKCADIYLKMPSYKKEKMLYAEFLKILSEKEYSKEQQKENL